jgi:hypothetical protein
LAGGAQSHGLAAKAAVGRLWGVIGPIRPISSIQLLIPPMLDAGNGQLLAITAFVNEIALKGPNLLIEQVVGLVDQTDDSVGDDRRISVVEPVRVSCAI